MIYAQCACDKTPENLILWLTYCSVEPHGDVEMRSCKYISSPGIYDWSINLFFGRCCDYCRYFTICEKEGWTDRAVCIRNKRRSTQLVACIIRLRGHTWNFSGNFYGNQSRLQNKRLRWWAIFRKIRGVLAAEVQGRQLTTCYPCFSVDCFIYLNHRHALSECLFQYRIKERIYITLYIFFTSWSNRMFSFSSLSLSLFL